MTRPLLPALDDAGQLREVGFALLLSRRHRPIGVGELAEATGVGLAAVQRTVLLCGDEHGTAWSRAQTGRGELLDLAEGGRRRAADWAGCAIAAERLA